MSPTANVTSCIRRGQAAPGSLISELIATFGPGALGDGSLLGQEARR